MSRVEDSDPRVQYSGPWFPQADGQASGGMRHGTKKGKATASLKFTGSSIQVIGVMIATDGNPVSLYYIDGQYVTTFTAQPPRGDEYNTVFMSKNGLGPGEHEVRIENENGGEGQTFWLDYFLVDPADRAAEPPPSQAKTTTTSQHSSATPVPPQQPVLSHTATTTTTDSPTTTPSGSPPTSSYLVSPTSLDNPRSSNESVPVPSTDTSAPLSSSASASMMSNGVVNAASSTGIAEASSARDTSPSSSAAATGTTDNGLGTVTKPASVTSGAVGGSGSAGGNGSGIGSGNGGSVPSPARPNIGPIAGGVIGALLLLLIIVIVVFLLRRRRRPIRRDDADSEQDDMSEAHLTTWIPSKFHNPSPDSRPSTIGGAILISPADLVALASATPPATLAPSAWNGGNLTRLSTATEDAETVGSQSEWGHAI